MLYDKALQIFNQEGGPSPFDLNRIPIPLLKRLCAENAINVSGEGRVLKASLIQAIRQARPQVNSFSRERRNKRQSARARGVDATALFDAPSRKRKADDLGAQDHQIDNGVTSNAMDDYPASKRAKLKKNLPTDLSVGRVSPLPPPAPVRKGARLKKILPTGLSVGLSVEVLQTASASIPALLPQSLIPARPTLQPPTPTPLSPSPPPPSPPLMPVPPPTPRPATPIKRKATTIEEKNDTVAKRLRLEGPSKEVPSVVVPQPYAQNLEGPPKEVLTVVAPQPHALRIWILIRCEDLATEEGEAQELPKEVASTVKDEDESKRKELLEELLMGRKAPSRSRLHHFLLTHLRAACIARGCLPMDKSKESCVQALILWFNKKEQTSNFEMRNDDDDPMSESPQIEGEDSEIEMDLGDDLMPEETESEVAQNGERRLAKRERQKEPVPVRVLMFHDSSALEPLSECQVLLKDGKLHMQDICNATGISGKIWLVSPNNHVPENWITFPVSFLDLRFLYSSDYQGRFIKVTANKFYTPRKRGLPD